MTVHNNSQFLDESIGSILCQNEIDYEFLIVNDGSTENIDAKILSFNDSRIHYFKLGKVGLVNALNEGIKHCKSKYIAIMDSDDIAPQNRLREQFNFLESNDDVGIVGTSIKYITERNSNSSWVLKMPSDHNNILKGLLKANYVLAHSTIMIRTDLINLIGGYCLKSYPVPDLDLFLRAAKIKRLANLSGIFSLYRLHESSLTANNLLPIIKKKYEIIGQSKRSSYYIYKSHMALIYYRKGVISFINKNYFISIIYFLITFSLSPVKSINYLLNKFKFI